MRELAGASAVRLARAIGAREASAREVAEAHLRRIEAVNGAVDALVQVDAERALAAADAADAALARGAPTGPLHGVPFTVKDNLSAAGIVMAIGDPARARTVADRDATAVARMRAAGAILLGKTNCPEYGGGIETGNAVYGRIGATGGFRPPGSAEWHLSRGMRDSGATRRRSRTRRPRRASAATTFARVAADLAGPARDSAGSQTG